MSRLILALLAGAFAMSARASDDKVRAAIQTLVPQAKIDSIAESVLPGIYEVVLEGQIVYVSADGRYLVQGSVFDINTRTDVTETTRAGIRVKALKALDPAKRITYAPANPKHTVTVFTDIDCGYCRRLHNQMAEYNKLGIAVQYLFFPRSGPGTESFTKAVSVWCADDQRKAMDNAKAGSAIEPRTCDSPVDEEYRLGQQIGVNGTPAIITADGTQVGGYVPPDQLLKRLDELAAAKPKS